MGFNLSRFLNVPYEMNGSIENGSADCYTLTRDVRAAMGKSTPHFSYVGKAGVDIDKIVGDLLSQGKIVKRSESALEPGSMAVIKFYSGWALGTAIGSDSVLFMDERLNKSRVSSRKTLQRWFDISYYEVT